MGGEGVGAGLDRQQGRPQRIGPRAAPCVAKGGDVIDIDSETQRRSVYHSGLADKFRRRSDNRMSCAGLSRASILFVKMDCRERRQVYVLCARQTTLPGNDEPGYPLTRSTRATTALARNWAIIALRCFRSQTSRSMVSSVKSGERLLMLILSILPS